MPFMAMTEAFQLSVSPSVFRRSVVERPHLESSVTRTASICLACPNAITFLRPARSCFAFEPVSLKMLPLHSPLARQMPSDHPPAAHKTYRQLKHGKKWRRDVPIEPLRILVPEGLDLHGLIVAQNRLCFDRDNHAYQGDIFWVILPVLTTFSSRVHAAIFSF